MNKIVAFAGIDVELPETQWEEEATEGLFHIKNKEMIFDLKSILQDEFAVVTQQHTQKLQTSHVEFPNNTTVPLTKREGQCLQHLLQGHSAKVTGNILFLSQRTVEEYLNNIRSKFNVRSKLELISLLSKAKINF